jgi:hypothetical protein
MLSGPEKLTVVQNLVPFQKYGSTFRLVDESDAEFIFRLRTDTLLSRFISRISDKVEDQEEWIKEYKKRELRGEEFYFISFDSETLSRQGLNRIYSFHHDQFELGSWLYVPDTDISKSILGDICVRELAFNHLLFNTCTFEVRKENKSVIRYHQGFSPELTGEDSLNFYYKLSKTMFNLNKNKYLNIFGYGFNK